MIATLAFNALIRETPEKAIVNILLTNILIKYDPIK